jgi:hypothetical protein
VQRKRDAARAQGVAGKSNFVLEMRESVREKVSFFWEIIFWEKVVFEKRFIKRLYFFWEIIFWEKVVFWKRFIKRLIMTKFSKSPSFVTFVAQIYSVLL